MIVEVCGSGDDLISEGRPLEAISQMAFPQEHENTKTRNNLKAFFFVVSAFVVS
jgi:hypothetical protein